MLLVNLRQEMPCTHAVAAKPSVAEETELNPLDSFATWTD
jgi:hypothetical protein